MKLIQTQLIQCRRSKCVCEFAEGSPKFLDSIKQNKNVFSSTAIWTLQVKLFIEIGMGPKTSQNRYRGSTLTTSEAFVNEEALHMKRHQNYDLRNSTCYKKVEQCKEGKAGITKENFVKEYF